MTVAEKAAAILLDYDSKPLCECGNPVEFVGKFKDITPFGGWRKFCSRTCMQSSKSTVAKRKQTTLDRFGEVSWAKTTIAKETSTAKWSDEKKHNFRKSLIETYQTNYGVDFYSQTPEYLEKRKATVLAQTDGKYTNYFQDVDRVKNGMIEKHGVDNWKKTDSGKQQSVDNNPMHDPRIVDKARLVRMSRSNKHDHTLLKILLNRNATEFKEYIDKIATNNSYTSRNAIADHLGISISYMHRLFRQYEMHNDYLTLGTCTSYEEETVYQFIKSIYDGPIVRGDRSIIKPQEIDIVLPELKLGIEYNGIRYHSELGGKDKHYHVNKTDLSEQSGYSLLHIFSNEWLSPIKRPIWESILRAKMNLLSERIYARKCALRQISHSEAKEFFNSNHLAGSIPASTYLGLFHKNALVSALSYGPSRFSKNEIEIYRFASSLNTLVVGAMGKFLSTMDGKNLVSFADRRLSSALATSYSRFFNSRISIEPSWYGFDTRTQELKHRWNFTKSKVTFLLGGYDNTKTVIENMFANGYDRIWDCGNWKYYNQ